MQLNAKKTTLILTIILFTTTATADITFNDEDPVEFKTDLNLNQNTAFNFSNPTNNREPVTLGYANDNYYNLNGDTLTGNINVNGNQIQNFFQNNCDAGEVIAHIQNTGRFTCTDITQATANTYLNESGDTLEGDLNINGQKLETGGQPITLQDTTNNQNILTAQEGGNIQIPNGNLRLGGERTEIKGFDESGNHWFKLAGGSEPDNLFLRVQDNGDTGVVDRLQLRTNGQSTISAKPNNNVHIPNGNLRLENNRIANIGASGTNFRSSGSLDLEGESVLGVNQLLSSEDELARVQFNTGVDLEVGDGSGTRIDALRTDNGGDVGIPNGDLSVFGTTDGIDLDNPGNAIIISNGQYAIPANAIKQNEISSTATSPSISGGSGSKLAVVWNQATDLNANGNLSSGTVQNDELANNNVTVIAGNQLSGGGHLELGGQTTVSVIEGIGSGLDADLLDGLQSTDFCKSDGSNCPIDNTGTDDQNLSVNLDVSGTNDQITIENGNTITLDDDFEPNTDNQNLAQVLNQGNTADNNINLTGQDLNSIRHLRFGKDWSAIMTSGSGNGVVNIYDQNTGQDIARFKEGGNVEIPNGNLDIQANSIVNLSNPSKPQDAATKSYVDNNDNTGTDDQNLGTSGNQITIESGNSITAPYANNANLLDGNQPSELNWGNLGISQTDVSKADVGLENVENEAQVSESGDTINGVLTVNHGSNLNGLRLLNTVNDPNSPAPLLIATDDDGEDLAIEVRSNSDGTSVNTSQNHQDTADTSFKVWSDGRTDIANPANTGKTLDVGGGANLDGNLDLNTNDIINGDVCLGGICDKNSYSTFDSSGIGVSNIHDGSGDEIDIQSQINFNGNNVKNLDFGSASDLTESGDISSFDNANDLDSGGNIVSNAVGINQVSDDIANGKNSASLGSSAGWYRIASNGGVKDGLSNGDSNSGDRASATFVVEDTESGQHSTTIFHASVHYGKEPTLSLVSRSSYGGNGVIEKVRLVEGETYEGAAVEVYVDGEGSSGNVEYQIYNDVQDSGWTPVDWNAGSVPTGFSTTVLDLTTKPVLATAANGGTNDFEVDRNGGVKANCIGDQC